MSESKRKLILKNLKQHNTMWHPESTLVFKSVKDRSVIGRYVDGELIQLDETALQLCDEWKFQPDESLLEQDDDVQEEEPADSEEPEEEVPETPESEGEIEDPEPIPVKQPVKVHTPVVNEQKPVNRKQASPSVPTPTQTASKPSPSLPLKGQGQGDGDGDVNVDAIIGQIRHLAGQLSEERDKMQELDIMYKSQNIELDILTGNLDTLRNEHDTLKNAYATLQDEYTAVKKKFDTMKSLFS